MKLSEISILNQKLTVLRWSQIRVARAYLSWNKVMMMMMMMIMIGGFMSLCQ